MKLSLFGNGSLKLPPPPPAAWIVALSSAISFQAHATVWRGTAVILNQIASGGNVSTNATLITELYDQWATGEGSSLAPAISACIEHLNGLSGQKPDNVEFDTVDYGYTTPYYVFPYQGQNLIFQQQGSNTFVCEFVN